MRDCIGATSLIHSSIPYEEPIRKGIGGWRAGVSLGDSVGNIVDYEFCVALRQGCIYT